MSKRDIIIEVVGAIPKKTVNKPSKYAKVVKALVENRGKALKISSKNGNSISASGLRNAVRRLGEKFGIDITKVRISEIRGELYALYE